MVYRILTFDGGGVRGLLTARLLERLDEDPSISGWRKKAHMMAGTSTGGLLALGLGLGKTPSEIISFYHTNAPLIFRQPLNREITDLGNLLGAKYSNVVLLQKLKYLLGARSRLDDLEHTVVVPSFDLASTWTYSDDTGETDAITTWKPKIFHNDKADPNGNDGDQFVYDVAMRTSAAPTYLPSYGSFVDGGVVANNPCMIALAQALADVLDGNKHRNLDQMVLLSLGTGVRESKIGGEDHDWGDAQWIKAGIVDLLMEGAMDVARYECRQLLRERLCRVCPYLDGNIPLDDASPETLTKLVDIANNVDINPIVAWILNRWLPDG